ncbi:MAG: hypothetical protein ABI868_14860 [Acidobacteriota bacterium]
MGKPPKKPVKSRKAARTAQKLTKWAAGLAVVAAVGYGLSQTSGFPFDADDLAIVDFTILNAAEQRTALRAANGARCSCGCGMTLAQCVATDMSCPVRDPNIDRLRKIVNDAKGK